MSFGLFDEPDGLTEETVRTHKCHSLGWIGYRVLNKDVECHATIYTKEHQVTCFIQRWDNEWIITRLLLILECFVSVSLSPYKPCFQLAGSNLSFIIISLQVKKFKHSQIPWFRCVCAYMLEYNQGKDVYRLLSKMWCFLSALILVHIMTGKATEGVLKKNTLNGWLQRNDVTGWVLVLE